MAGIYVHIPFCKTRCAYCDFYSNTDLSFRDELVNALCTELEREKNYIGREAIDTIYFGGGTPSLLSEAHFNRLFDAINLNFDISHATEITLEANPDDLTEEYISMLRRLPFNRISIGVQSLIDKELQMINRRHDACRAITCVADCQAAGFENVSVDLIYAYPSQTVAELLLSLEGILKMGVQHVSAYNLTYEEGTALYKKLQAGDISAVDDEVAVEMYKTLINKLEENGFLQYEISNFARRGCESKHNSSYWKGVAYLGVGPSAHSYNGATRKWNVASIADYMKKIQTNEPAFELERLSATDVYNEYIITGLRTKKGVSLEGLREKFGADRFDYCMKNADKFLINKELEVVDGFLRCTLEGFVLSNGIMADLMLVE